jgi:hypothetical protein
MAKFTFLEVHFTDSELSATKGYESGEKAVSAADEPLESESGSKKGSAIAALIGLAFLVAVAYLVKTKVLDSEAEESFEFSDGDSFDDGTDDIDA